LPALQDKRKTGAIFFRWYYMKQQFKKGDAVRWQSSGGASIGKVIEVHTKDFTFKGVKHRAAANEPLYEVKSDKSGQTAVHKGPALHS